MLLLELFFVVSLFFIILFIILNKIFLQFLFLQNKIIYLYLLRSFNFPFEKIGKFLFALFSKFNLKSNFFI